jgi:hypothetical protein
LGLSAGVSHDAFTGVGIDEGLAGRQDRFLSAVATAAEYALKVWERLGRSLNDKNKRKNTE